MQVAKTILEQLGGNRFIAMTGARDFVGAPDSLRFRLPRNPSRVNVVVVTLDASDLYRVQFLKMAARGLDITTLADVAGVYADQLQSIFTARTGLDTTL